EFALCIFILLPIACRIWRARPWTALGLLLFAALFAIDLLYVMLGRTVLVGSAVLICIFAFWQFGWRKGGVFLLLALAAAVAVWQSSPFLRSQVGLIRQEIREYESENVRTRSGERVEFWKRSISFVAQAPIFGHGTGTIRELFRRSAVGETGAAATVSPNPHNQTLAVAIQLGLVGTVVLYAMWVAHLLLFRGGTLPDWIGLVIVVQNIVSSLFNSHLFDFTQGWMYVFGVGIAGGAVLGQRISSVAVQKSASFLPRVRLRTSEPKPHENQRFASVRPFRNSHIGCRTMGRIRNRDTRGCGSCLGEKVGDGSTCTKTGAVT
ncbi:MAG TPA: O-antigen ligase family protein, partial [Xanthobacteraceae bacterium]